MLKIHSILFPTDFSDESKAAIPYLTSLAENYSSKVHILHVLEDFVLPVDMSWAAFPQVDIQGDRIARAEEALDEVAAGLKEFDPSTALDFGSPHRKIAEYAEQQSIDLIVIPTHGRSGLSQFLMGSTAERVVRHAACAVLTPRAV